MDFYYAGNIVIGGRVLPLFRSVLVLATDRNIVAGGYCRLVENFASSVSQAGHIQDGFCEVSQRCRRLHLAQGSQSTADGAFGSGFVKH